MQVLLFLGLGCPPFPSPPFPPSSSCLVCVCSARASELQRWDPLVSASLALLLLVFATALDLLGRSWGLKSGLHVCVASTLLTEPSFQSQFELCVYIEISIFKSTRESMLDPLPFLGWLSSVAINLAITHNHILLCWTLIFTYRCCEAAQSLPKGKRTNLRVLVLSFAGSILVLFSKSQS